MSNFNGVIKRSIMRELSADVADAMRTSSQIEVETENYDLDFSDVINQTPVEEAEAEQVTKPAQTVDQPPEFGHPNSNHLEEPPRCEDCGKIGGLKAIKTQIESLKKD